MKFFFIILILLIISNFSFSNEFELKVNILKEQNILKIEGEIAYIKGEEWIKLVEKEKINLLEILNKYSRSHNEKYITIIKELEIKKILVIIGIFGIELKE